MNEKIEGKINQKCTKRSCDKKYMITTCILHRINLCAHKDNISISNLPALCIQNDQTFQNTLYSQLNGHIMKYYVNTCV